MCKRVGYKPVGATATWVKPLRVGAKLDRLAGSVEIKGRIGDRPWVVTMPVANAAEGKGLSKLWARRKIADSEIARTMRQATPEDADRTILGIQRSGKDVPFQPGRQQAGPMLVDLKARLADDGFLPAPVQQSLHLRRGAYAFRAQGDRVVLG